MVEEPKPSQENVTVGSELIERLGDTITVSLESYRLTVEDRYRLQDELSDTRVERDNYREALEQIRDATIDCNGGLLQSIHAIAQVALDPEGCKDLARIKDA